MKFRAGLLTLLLFLIGLRINAQTTTEAGYIRGRIQLDTSWERMVYLSYIPTFEEIHAMANDMIIAEASLDTLGYFSMDLRFLPEKTQLFRLHLVKRGDTPNSLIIGGQEENYLLLLAHKNSAIQLEAKNVSPPFQGLRFKPGTLNVTFQQITDLVQQTYTQANQSTAARRQFMESQLFDQLRTIADTSRHAMISLYAIYQSDFTDNHLEHLNYYQNYLRKWSREDSAYFVAFRQKIPARTNHLRTVALVIGGIGLIAVGFYLGKQQPRTKNPGLRKLTVQERKIYAMLQQGQSNQQISEACHIGVSTVKSHVSSIYRKLNVSSRKEVMNM